MRERWHLPFPVVSDPDGVELLKPLDAWNPDERDGIAWPMVVLFAPDGSEVLRMRSRDFADRPDDDDVLDALGSLDLPAVELGAAPPAAEPVEDRGAFRVDAFGPYYRGIRFSSMALVGRLATDDDKSEAKAMGHMAGSFLDAWKQRRDQGDGAPS